MIRKRLERQVEAYRDGALPARERARLEARLERDTAAAEHLATTQWLGSAVRESWSEGPAAPPADRILAAIAPELRRIDRERSAQTSAWRSWLGAILRPAPLTACAGAAAAALLLALPGAWSLPELGTSAPGPSGTVKSTPISVAEAATLGSPDGVYDIAQGDSPLLVFEADDGSIVIWPLEEEDDVSSQGVRSYA